MSETLTKTIVFLASAAFVAFAVWSEVDRYSRPVPIARYEQGDVRYDPFSQ